MHVYLESRFYFHLTSIIGGEQIGKGKGRWPKNQTLCHETRWDIYDSTQPKQLANCRCHSLKCINTIKGNVTNFCYNCFRLFLWWDNVCSGEPW